MHLDKVESYMLIIVIVSEKWVGIKLAILVKGYFCKFHDSHL